MLSSKSGNEKDAKKMFWDGIAKKEEFLSWRYYNFQDFPALTASFEKIWRVAHHEGEASKFLSSIENSNWLQNIDNMVKNALQAFIIIRVRSV